MKEYALYKGDNILSIGTISEIAKELKIKEKSVRYYNTPTYKRRTTKKNGRRLVKIS